MNGIIENDWFKLFSKNCVDFFEAQSAGKPKWWKMIDENGDMAFVEFSFELDMTSQKAFDLHDVSIDEKQFGLLWIESLWVPNERRGKNFGFILLQNLQEHFIKNKLSFCGLKVSPFEDNTEFYRLKNGYLKQGFLQDKRCNNILIK